MWILNGLHVSYVRRVGWGGLRSRRKQFFRRPWCPLAWAVQIHWRHGGWVDVEPPAMLSIQLFQQPQLPYGRITSLRAGGLTSPRRQQQRCRHIEGFQCHYYGVGILHFLEIKFFYQDRARTHQNTWGQNCPTLVRNGAHFAKPHAFTDFVSRRPVRTTFLNGVTPVNTPTLRLPRTRRPRWPRAPRACTTERFMEKSKTSKTSQQEGV